MITTLLFDLDDTLLGNDMDVFLPAYFRGLAPYLPAGVDPQHFATELIHATRAMIANADPGRVLYDVFAECFSRGIGLPPEAWAPVFDRFYAEGYRNLQSQTQRWPAARASVEWAVSHGYDVAIATSPLFAETPVRERLRWAGIEDLPYVLVTSAETSHFAKPRPEYYAETLGRLGLRPEQALVVGNDWENDILAAAAVGVPSFWVARERNPRSTSGPTDDRARQALAGVEPRLLGTGSLDHFVTWASEALGPARRDDGQPHAVPPARGLPHLLLGFAGAVAGRVASLDEAAWHHRPGGTEWSPTEILCHLRDVEREVNLPRLRAVIENENPFVAGADTDPWAVARSYQAQSGPAALASWLEARQEAVRFLSAQPPGIWDRTARHAIFGPTRLAEIVGWVVDHDLIHLRQLSGQ